MIWIFPLSNVSKQSKNQHHGNSNSSKHLVSIESNSFVLIYVLPMILVRKKNMVKYDITILPDIMNVSYYRQYTESIIVSNS